MNKYVFGTETLRCARSCRPTILTQHPCVPSLLPLSQPADSPDKRPVLSHRCSPNLDVLVFYLSPLANPSPSPFIAQSVMTSLIIPKHPKIDDTGGLFCLLDQAFLMSSVHPPFEFDLLVAMWPIKGQSR